MKKINFKVATIPIAVTGVLLLVFVLIAYSYKAQQHNEVAEENVVLKVKNEDFVNMNFLLKEENTRLRIERDSLRDIVVKKDNLIVAFQNEIADREKKSKKIKKGLYESQKQVKFLRTELDKHLVKKAKYDKYGFSTDDFVAVVDSLVTRINTLESRERRYKHQLNTTDDEVVNLRGKLAVVVSEKQTVENEKQLIDNLFSICEETKIEITESSLKTSKGNNVKKVKSTNWHSTWLTIKLSHPDSLLVPGMRFIVKIKDLDNNRVLEHLESKSGGGKQGAKEVEYQSDGKIHFQFTNYEKKIGKNFSLVLYIAEATPNGKQLQLKDSPKIVTAGKPTRHTNGVEI